MQSKIKKADPDKKYRRVLAASTLAGDSVRNSAGEDLGKVDEIMIDIPSGRVAYAVLSFGGVLGMGNKLFAVPWSALRVDEDKKCLRRWARVPKWRTTFRQSFAPPFPLQRSSQNGPRRQGFASPRPTTARP